MSKLTLQLWLTAAQYQCLDCATEVKMEVTKCDVRTLHAAVCHETHSMVSNEQVGPEAPH